MSLLIPFNPIVTQIASAATINSAYLLNNNITTSAGTASVFASENPIIFSFSSSAITNSIYGSEIWIDVNSGSTNDAYFLISATTEGSFPTYQLTAKAIPGINEYYSTGTTPSKSITEIADNIAFALNNNFSFRQRFYANSSGNRVFIQALEPGSRYRLSFSSSDGNISLALTINSLDSNRGDTLKDYAIWSDLYINSTGTLGDTLNRSGSTIVSSYENTYSKDNIYYVDVSSVLKNYVSTPLPNFTSSTFNYANETLVNSYLVYGEKYDEFRSNYRRSFLNGQTEIKWAMNSSLGYLDINSLDDYVVDGNFNPVKLLTLSPSPKYVYKDQKETRGFLYSNANTWSARTGLDFIVTGMTYGLDGNPMTATTQISIAGIISGGMLTFEYGPAQAGINNIESSFKTDVMYYTWDLIAVEYYGFVNHITHRLTPTGVTFNVLHDCEDHPIQLIFRNSLGWWDTFIFNAEVEVSVDRKIATFNSTLKDNILGLNTSSDHSDQSEKIVNIDITKTYKAYSDWIDRAHTDWLYEALKNTDAKIYENGEFHAITITKVDYKTNTSNNLFTVNIEYNYAVGENYITN